MHVPDAERPAADAVPIRITFWGTRGTVVPYVPSRFGIHTTCLEIQAGDAAPLFVDFGTGVIPAGDDALRRGIRTFDVWLTHTHSDHINGMFAFAPFYRDDCTIRIFTAAPEPREALERWFAPPYHPVPMTSVSAALEIILLPESGRKVFPEHGVTVAWGPLPHPQPCSGLRFEAGSSAFVFGTDVEILADGNGGALRRLLAEPFPAGLTAVDGFFPDSEVHKYVDWGHSSWKEAWRLCRETGVPRLLITHHHPGLGDERLLELEQSSPDAVTWARERTTWVLRGSHAECRDT